MALDKKSLSRLPEDLQNDIPMDDAPMLVFPEQGGKNILKYRRMEYQGQMIGRIASSFHFVDDDSMIGDLAHELHRNHKIQSVGIVDQNKKIHGFIDRKTLFDLLGRPHCRDVYSKRTVDKVMGYCRIFKYDENIFSVAEELDESLNDQNLHYYLLSDHEGHFAGSFTSTDLLIYLSGITKKDINLARKLQLSIFNEEHLTRGERFETLFRTDMAKGVGGDFYSIQKYSENRWHLSIGDVSGKGISASLVTAILGGMFRIYDYRKGLIPFVKNINNYIMQSFEMEKFITAIFIDFDEKAGKLTIADMGHSLFYIHRKGKTLQVKAGDENLPLGVMPDVEPKLRTFQLIKEDLIIILTDGIIEQANPAGEVFSMQRLINIIRTHHHSPINEIRGIIDKSLREFQGNCLQGDDLTYMLFRFTG